ncbi:MAG: amidohydrolase family protein [Clostridia bacterium]|nr:amidohydrolase family protein [Clostridia bacterium]
MSKILDIVKEGKRLSGELIIDSHCHCGNTMASFTPDNDPETIKGCLEKIGVSTACFCSRGAGVSGDPFLANNHTAQFIKEFPGLFKGYVTISANYPEHLEEIKRGEKIGLKLGIKMHTYRQPHDLNDPKFAKMLEYLNEKRKIFLHHYFGPPEQLEPLLKKYKDITFLEGHCIFEYAPLARKYDNMYINTCAEIGFDNIRRITALAGDDKVVYGSDMTALDSTFSLGAVAYARIPDDSKRKILGLNMDRLIKRIKD